MVRKVNPKAKMNNEIAEDYRSWLAMHPNAPRRKRIAQFDAIADAHYNLRKNKLKIERANGVARQSSPIR